MLTELKLLHAYIGGLIEEAESGALNLEHLHINKTDRMAYVELQYARAKLPAGCDHEYRRIASGEYECRTCGSVTDEPEGEQWQ